MALPHFGLPTSPSGREQDANSKHTYEARPSAAGAGGAGSFRQEAFPVAAGTTIYRGDIVTLTSGAVTQALGLANVGDVNGNNAATASSGTTTILGVAMASIKTDANGIEAGTGRTTLEVAVLDDNLEIGLRIYNAVAADADQAHVAVGTSYRFQRWRGANLSTWWYELTTTTPGELEVVARHPGTGADEDYGVVWVRCVDAAKLIGG